MKNLRNRLTSNINALFLMAGCCVIAYGQTANEPQTLRPNQTVEREMTGAETHRYTIKLKKNEFFQILVEQKGVDVTLKLLGADGVALATMDSPNGDKGSEVLSFVTITEGSYILEISRFNPVAQKGNYSVKRSGSRTATAKDRRRAELERLFVEVMTGRGGQGENEASLKKLEQILEGRELLKDSPLIDLAIEEITRLKLAKAVAVFDEAMVLFEKDTTETNKLAIGKFQEAGRLYAEIDEKNQGVGMAFLAVGLIYFRLNDRLEALNVLQKALLNFRLSHRKDWEATTLSYIGRIYESSGEIKKALEFHERALSIYQETRDIKAAATTLTNIGILYSELGMKQKALEFYEQALTTRSEMGNTREKALVLNNIGRIYDDLGEKKKALEIYDQGLMIFRQLDDKNGEAITLNNIGKIYDSLGEMQAAIARYNESLKLRRVAGNRAGEAVTLNNLGKVYADLGEKQKALDFFHQSLPLFATIGDRAGEAVAVNNLGKVYADLGEKQKAFEYYNRTLMLFREIRNTVGEANVLNNLGEIHELSGEYEKSRRFYEEALELYSVIGNKGVMAAMFNKLGLLSEIEGKNGKALEFYNRALAIFEALNDTDRQAAVWVNIGRLYGILKDEEKALNALNKAQLLAPSKNIVSGDKNEEGKDVETVGLKNSNQKWGSDLKSSGESQSGQEYYEESIILARKKGFLPGEANAFADLMFYWQAEKNYDLAIYYGKQAVNAFQQVRNKRNTDQGLQSAFLRNSLETYRNLAELLIERGRFAQAEKILSMLKEEEYFDFVRRDAGEIQKLCEKISLSDKEKALISRYSVLADKVTEIGKEFIELDNKKRQLSRRNLSLSSEEKKRYDELDKLLEDANAAFQLFLTKQLIAEIGNEKAAAIEIDRNLQDKLRKWGEGTVALYTVVGADRYRVVLTTAKTQVDGKTEIKIADLNKKVFAFRSALQDRKVDPRPLGQELYNILIKPIEKDLKGANAKTVLWSLDGTLRYIPLAALSPDGKRYLGQDMQNVVITPKTRDDISDSDSDWCALGLGVSQAGTVTNPEDSTRKIPFDPLPGTERELMSIIQDERRRGEKGVLPGLRFMNKDFTSAALKEALAKETTGGKRKYNVIHIASHFWLGSNDSSSFILLGNGQILTLEDIRNSPSLDFGSVELIALSACNTGFAGDTNGREIDSLASVIQTKSGKGVLATLWPVADNSTSLIMSEFYRLRKKYPNLTKAGAMQLAQKAMIEGRLLVSTNGKEGKTDTTKGAKSSSVTGNGAPPFPFDKSKPFAHPYYWSPFVLIGNWK